MSEVSNTSKVIKGMSSQTLVTIIYGVVEIVSFAIMSRLLTKEDFGYFASISAITAIFQSFSETGIGSAIVQQKNLTQRYINNAFTLCFLVGAFASLLLVATAAPIARSVADASMTVPLMLMSITLLLSCLTSVNNSLMQRKLQFMRIGAIRVGSIIVTTIVCIILAIKGFGYYAIITKALLTSVINYFVSLVLCKTHYSFALDKDTFKKIFSFSGWLMASVFFRNLAHQVDALLMPRLLSVSALGAYNRPKGFVDQISDKINGIFDSALFPVLSGVQDNKQAIYSAFCRSMFLMNVFSLVLSAGVLFNGNLIIRVFFGEEWLELYPVLAAIACTLLFNSTGRLADCFLRSLAMTKQQFFFRVFETVLKLSGILVGFRWGIIGVAVSVAITSMIARLVKIIYIGNRIEISPLRVLGMMFAAWRYGLLLLPVCIIAYIFLPATLGGDIVMAVLFTVLVLVIFLLMPKFVGKQYEEEVFVKITSYIDTIKKRRK